VTRRALTTFLAVGVALWFLPDLRGVVDFPLFYLLFLYTTFFWIAQASSWNVLSGYTGYFSFGQAAFFGVGVYTSAILVNRHGWDFFVTIPVAGVASALLALGVGGLAFRLRQLRGEIFALLTLAVSFILASVARFSPAIDGGQGIAISPPDAPGFLGGFNDMIFRLALVIGLLAVGGAYAIQHSRFGWGLFSIRDDEGVAEGLGVPTFRFKMAAIAVTGFLAGISGSVHSLQIGYVTVEDVFSLNLALFVILMSILGGRNHWLGPVVGAVFVFTMQDRLASAGFERWSQIAIGSILVLMVLFARDGLYLRLRARIRTVAAAFVVVFVLSSLLGVGGSVFDHLLFAMFAGILVALVPAAWLRPLRRTALAPDEPAPADADVPVVEAAGSLDPSAAVGPEERS
jgi:branched-chain amino acid transport system permease protein